MSGSSMAAPAGRGRRVAIFIVVAVIVLVADQLVKSWARVALADGATMALVPGVIDLVLVRNVGAAFGVLAGHTWVFVASAVLVCALCAGVVLFGRSVSTTGGLTLALIFAGGVGNAIDRILDGYVTDMIRLAFIDFPVFNIADIALTCGVCLLVLWCLFGSSFEEVPAQQAGEQREERGKEGQADV